MDGVDNKVSVQSRGRYDWAGFLLLVVAVIVSAYALFFFDMRTEKDVNPEMTDMPLAVEYMLAARHAGVPLETYFSTAPDMLMMKKEDPVGSYAYVGNRFHYSLFAYTAPILTVFFMPFVAMFGCTPDTVTAYSLFFAALAVITFSYFAFIAFGRWEAFLAPLLLFTCLTWLIHVKLVGASWMPSLFLLSCMAIVLYDYTLTGKGGRLWVAGVCLGLLYMVGWLSVVFGGLFLCLVLLAGGTRPLARTVLDGLLVSAVSVVTVIVFTWCYCLYFRCGQKDVYSTIYDVMFQRYSQGGVPGVDLTISGKLYYAFRCMFVDSRTYDHIDKCLEGRPGMSAVLGCFGLVGMVYAIRRRSKADVVVVTWCLSVFGFLAIAFLYTHRYVLLAMPAMAILAARGVTGLYGDLNSGRLLKLRPFFVGAVGLMVLMGLTTTYHDYYSTYVNEKPPNFEVDRVRGHFFVSTWLKANCRPDDTLVIMSDRIMFPTPCFLFNNFGLNYAYMYWANYAQELSTPEKRKAWEDALFKRYKQIIVLASPVLLGDPRTGACQNDVRPLLALHPGATPVTTYSYAGRPPSIYVFQFGH